MAKVRRGLVAWMLLAASVVGIGSPALAASGGPTIDIWYGTDQTFGTRPVGGHLVNFVPQTRADILGNVSDPDGVASLRYTLNGGNATTLTLGSGNAFDEADRRLARLGDFVVNIPFSALAATPGDDLVRLTAVDTGGNTSVVEVTVHYQPATAPVLPYTIDWSQVHATSGCQSGQPCAAINQVAQVVDGKWELDANGVRIIEPGYDRLIAIGDAATWGEYEVTVPITINHLAPDTAGVSGTPGFGLLTGWQGHTTNPAGAYQWLTGDGRDVCGGVVNPQPLCGWEPFGVIAWYTSDGTSPGHLEYEAEAESNRRSQPLQLVEGRTYVFRLRVERNGSQLNTFALDVWNQTNPGTILQTITTTETATRDDGSLLLISHHHDVTFGDVSVRPLTARRPPAQVGVFNPASGEWRLRSADGSTNAFYYGNPGDVPLLGDWDCDGIDTVGAFRPKDGFAYLRNSNDFGVADVSFYFGIRGDIPVAGDWDGDGCDTLGVFRGDGHVFLTNRLVTAYADTDFWFGAAGDQPLAGDFDGDGLSEVGVFRPSTNFVYLRWDHTSGIADHAFPLVTPGNLLVVGDWDNDSIDTIGIWRATDATFYLSNTNDTVAADHVVAYGSSSWTPVAGSFN